MAASLAATEQARRLDPRIRTSGAHTHFMLGDYEKVSRLSSLRRSRTCRTSRLVMLGRTPAGPRRAEADRRGVASRLVFFTEALRHTLEGNREEAMRTFAG